MKHVCVATSAHPWDDVRVASRIATAFIETGYRLTWVGPDRALSSGRGYRVDGIDYRLFSTGSSRVDRLLGTSRALKLAKEVEGVDWWYSPDPDMAGRLPALAARKGGKTIFDVHESYHGGLLERWFPITPPDFIRDLLRRKIARTCESVDVVMGVSDRVLEPYCQRQPNTIVVRNLAPAPFAPERPAQHRVGKRMRVMHGKLSAGNGTSQVAHAVALLPPEIQEQVSVVMLDVSSTLASARDRVKSIADTVAEGALTVSPGVPHDQMADLMATCGVGMISYQRDLGYESLPNRLFEYMASGLAILAPSYSPEIVKILEAEQIGLTADFEVPSEIARLLEWCARHPSEVARMGARARAAYVKRYTWDNEALNLLNHLKALE